MSRTSQQPSGGWNNNTNTESKFFDKSIDKDYLRKQNKQTGKGNVINSDILPFTVDKDLENGKSI